jgi:hypothetical protein
MDYEMQLKHMLEEIIDKVMKESTDVDNSDEQIVSEAPQDKRTRESIKNLLAKKSAAYKQYRAIADRIDHQIYTKKEAIKKRNPKKEPRSPRKSPWAGQKVDTRPYAGSCGGGGSCGDWINSARW